MTHYYLNSTSGSDANTGLSEAQAWASFGWALGATSGFTGGDYLWVKAGTTYSPKNLELNTYSYEPMVHIYGYDSVTGDNCVDGDLPIIIDDDYYNNVHIAWNKYKYDVRNFLIQFNPNSGYQRVRLPASGHNITSNINIDADYSGAVYASNNGLLYPQGSESSRSLKGYNIKFKNLTNPVNGIVINESQSGCYHKPVGCIFDASEVSATNTYIWGANNGYGQPDQMGNVYIGNPSASGMVGLQYYAQGGSAYGLILEDCVFYNLDIGIYAYASDTSLHPNWLLTSTASRYRFEIRNCIFVNCGTGIKFDTTSIPDWYHFNITDCIFYNSTTTDVDGCSNVNNSIIATQNPFDIDNMCLTDYGKEIARVPYRKYGSASNPFGTTNRKRHSLYTTSSNYFSTTDSGSISLGTGGVGDTVTVSGRSFQKVDDDPIVWRRVRV